MKVLHIINDYWWSKLYSNLVKELDAEVEQVIYVPIRNAKDFDKNKVEGLKNTSYYYSHIITSFFDRLFFFKKIKKIQQDIERNIDLSDINVIHAHTLFSDGGVAYKLSKKHGIPFITTVRNTDVNVFFKYLYHTHSFGRKVLRNASKVVFLSPTYLSRLSTKILPKELASKVQSKSKIIPNGIDAKWHALRKNPIQKTDDVWRLFFIGQFVENKNLQGLIRAAEKLKNKRLNIEVHAIGLNPDTDDAYVAKHKELLSKSYVFTYDAIKDFTELSNQISNYDILVVPSFHETFGLVYAEALTLNKPVIYSRNEGFDGQFENGIVGFAIDPHNIDDIANHIEKIIDHYDDFQERIANLDLKQFDWNQVSCTFKSIYSELCKE